MSTKATKRTLKKQLCSMKREATFLKKQNEVGGTNWKENQRLRKENTELRLVMADMLKERGVYELLEEVRGVLSLHKSILFPDQQKILDLYQKLTLITKEFPWA